METFRSPLKTIWTMKKLYTLSLIGLLFSCADEHEKLDSFAKLNGTWEFKSPDGKFVETWGLREDSVIMGQSSSLWGKDTLFSEKLKIVSRKGKILYIPTVSNQNKGKEVVFELFSQKENLWIFTNPKHDFPQKITYEFKGKDSLIATISGNQDGVYQSIPIPMKKVK